MPRSISSSINSMELTMPLAGLITCILIITLGIADLCFVLVKGSGSSVSQFLINAGFKAPFVVFTFGAIIGHLFCYMYIPMGSPIQYPWFVACQGMAVGLVFGYLARYFLFKSKPNG